MSIQGDDDESPTTRSFDRTCFHKYAQLFWSKLLVLVISENCGSRPRPEICAAE
jgi:hypothetical protein